jgi:hypothetical protein
MMAQRCTARWVTDKTGNREDLRLTHASSVIPDVSCSEAAFGTVTNPPPLNTSPLPNLPWVVQVTPLPSVPVLLLPELSATVGPAPSEKLYAASSPVGVAVTVG